MTCVGAQRQQLFRVSSVKRDGRGNHFFAFVVALFRSANSIYTSRRVAQPENNFFQKIIFNLKFLRNDSRAQI